MIHLIYDGQARLTYGPTPSRACVDITAGVPFPCEVRDALNMIERYGMRPADQQSADAIERALADETASALLTYGEQPREAIRGRPAIRATNYREEVSRAFARVLGK